MSTILDFHYLVIITHFTNCIRSEFLSEILTKPPHILTHAGAFLRAILVAHDHRNPSHQLDDPNFPRSLITLLSRSLINAPRIILYFDGDEFLANRFARMETFRITRGRSAIASRDTSAPPSRSLNGFIGFRTHERTIGAVNASYLSFSSVNQKSFSFPCSYVIPLVISISLFEDRNTSFRILLVGIVSCTCTPNDAYTSYVYLRRSSFYAYVFFSLSLSLSLQKTRKYSFETRIFVIFSSSIEVRFFFKQKYYYIILYIG